MKATDEDIMAAAARIGIKVVDLTDHHSNESTLLAMELYDLASRDRTFAFAVLTAAANMLGNIAASSGHGHVLESAITKAILENAQSIVEARAEKGKTDG